MEPTIIVTEDRLAGFRQQIRDEDETRPKMSEAAKAKLRSINERDRTNAEADARLVEEFNSRSWTLDQLVDVFAKSFGGTQRIADASPRRRAVKAIYRLAQGARVYHIHDISMFGELSSDEAEMPMSRFLARYPLPEDEAVTPKGAPVKTEPVRLCALGRKCLRAVRNRAAEVSGKSQCCSVNCRGRARILARRVN